MPKPRNLPNFYPRPPRGGRPSRSGWWCPLRSYFYPRPPRGGRQDGLTRYVKKKTISIHALREEGDTSRGSSARCIPISIHALREEGDRPPSVVASKVCYFYPRPPRGGRRDLAGVPGAIYRFLSTPSARRATGCGSGCAARREEFLSTPSARRATLPAGCKRPATGISIHALREEGDKIAFADLGWYEVFLSTPSARRATRNGPTLTDFLYLFLSTPSARRATGRYQVRQRHFENFYPRPPRGGRLAGWDVQMGLPKFLSTPSARRATQEVEV